MVDEVQAPPQDAVPAFRDLPAAALQAAWDSSPALVVVTVGPDHLLAYQNRASQVMFGARPVGLPLAEGFPEVSAAAIAPLGEVFRTGEQVEVIRRRSEVRDLTGEEVILGYVLSPLAAPGDPPRGVVVTAIDVTAEARAEQAAAQARLLAELSARLTGASSPTSGLQALTDALVPVLADLAAVYIVADGAGGGAGPDIEPVPPQVMTIADWLAPIGPPPPPSRRDGPSPWEGSLRAGEPLVLALDAESLPQVALHPAAADWLTRATAHSVAVVPLVVAGSLTGAMVLLGTGDRIPYRAADIPFLSDVAARAGVAISQVATQQRQREVALRLQRALLPAVPPPVPGMEVAARYLAGAPGVEVGGDWWDVQDLGGGQVGVGIGDVSGRGVSAAAVMGQARAAMRAAGHARLPPAEVLALLDAQLYDVIGSGRLDEPTSPQFATACYAVVEPDDCRLRLANAGHLPPLRWTAAGGTGRLALPTGTPLGLGRGGYAETTVEFRAGDVLAMFTDGLVELHDRDLDEGMDLLAAALDRFSAEPSLDELADRLLETMSQRPGYGQDDVALVLVRLAICD